MMKPGIVDGSRSLTCFLGVCSSSGELSKAKILLEKDPLLAHATTKNGEHCLHLTALSGSAEIAKLILDAGADPNIRSTWDSGLRMHPLSWNTFYGRHEIIELLLKYGADVNADFDLDAAKKATVLDVIEQILLGAEDREDKAQFVETRNVLVKNGALRYASLEPEL
jgi:ankyrin repeat protein